MSKCCYTGRLGPCSRQATQAFDVWSWFEDISRQTPQHYEVCDKHGEIFHGYTGGRRDERTQKVRDRYTPTDLTQEEVAALRRLCAIRRDFA